MEFDETVYERTIEDEIRSSDELSPAEKNLLIQESRIHFYQALLIFVPLLLLIGVIGVLLRGWLLAIVDLSLFWGTAIAYTLLQDWEERVKAELAEEFRKRKTRTKKRS